MFKTVSRSIHSYITYYLCKGCICTLIGQLICFSIRRSPSTNQNTYECIDRKTQNSHMILFWNAIYYSWSTKKYMSIYSAGIVNSTDTLKRYFLDIWYFASLNIAIQSLPIVLWKKLPCCTDPIFWDVHFDMYFDPNPKKGCNILLASSHGTKIKAQSSDYFWLFGNSDIFCKVFAKDYLSKRSKDVFKVYFS